MNWNQRLLTAIACLSLVFLLLWSQPTGAQNTQNRMVRVVYLVSKDRKVSPEYQKGIRHAVMQVQDWYDHQLGGPTFRVFSPVPEVVYSTRPASWFYGNPNGTNKDDWGFYNTLQEAEKLVGARHNDPHFIWVIYSDGPGNKGRGGSGVTCLPEEDLLGLIGKDRSFPHISRWVGGLGHELGHAFGLEHPADTNQDGEAIMWMGFYEKFPDGCYLTARDKAILMQSPFFFYPNGSPVVGNKPLAEMFTYPGGYFGRISEGEGRDWKEGKTDSTEVHFFKEFERTGDQVVLKDLDRQIMIALPLRGGVSQFSTDDGASWQQLYSVKKE